ncbi:hypothetical protein F0562_020756 [Nyssa sinensis]|uniref:Uncharacterized protein n=1 Tax=Nyssa sinensis TaxID=561372 RepID=A0A5J5BRQ2_9ASTE|nr:hypothetical protein F0562_020756 [Nyssa sinensis]
MARAGVFTKTNLLVFRESKTFRRYASKLAADLELEDKHRSIKQDDPPFWVPHPRTGIYFPKGHEWVMKDVPDGAASFAQTYWLRNIVGVDHKPDPHLTLPDYNFHTN